MSSEAACVHCGSSRLYRSKRRGGGERALALLGARMRRCHDCNTRFVQLGGSLLKTTDLGQVGRRLMLGLVMAAALMVVLALIMWLNSHQGSADPS